MAAFDPEAIFAVLAKHRVKYVLIGGVAATLHGSPLRTGDVDICPARNRANLGHLADALGELEAGIRGASSGALRFPREAAFLERMEIVNLTTRFGELDLVFQPPGTKGYEPLARRAVRYDLGALRVPTASLADLIRTKEAAGRSKDREQLETLQVLREETRRSRRRLRRKKSV
jgi:hypothetical protein